ncbi:hypothetical protein BDN72DRAFT_801395, partial [Pluteus cervinus]
MILDKYLNPEESHDAPPPSYDTLPGPPIPIASGSTSYPLDTKKSPISSSPHFPSPVASTSTSSSSKGKGKSKAPSSSSSSSGFSFNFFNSRATRDVKNTVLGLIQDIVRESHASPPSPTESDSAPLLILRSCADACTKERLSLSSLLQEKYIGGHTPIYWSILNRPKDTLPMITYDDSSSSSTTTSLLPPPSQTPDLLTVLLHFARPLTQNTITEIRLACLPNSDQPLFQRLRLIPEFSSISQTDEMILGTTIPSDNVEVENLPGDAGEFAADLEIVQFQRRMRVARRIEVEFIARARLWRISFCIAPDGPTQYGSPRPGSWCISLSLLACSSPTYIDSRILIAEPTPEPLPPQQGIISLIDSPPERPNPSVSYPSSNSHPPTNSKPPKPRPTITLRLKSDKKLASQDQKRNAAQGMETEVVVALEDSLMAASLQHAY